MTARDFRTIARTLRETRAVEATNAHKRRVLLAQDFAIALATTNERFDHARFMEAATGNPPLRDA